MSKIQDKHEKQLNEMAIENRKSADKIAFLDDRNKAFSSEIHGMNDERLKLLKEHEILKSKLRSYEIGTTLNGANVTASASNFFDKMRGGKNFINQIANLKSLTKNLNIFDRCKFPNGR